MMAEPRKFTRSADVQRLGRTGGLHQPQPVAGPCPSGAPRPAPPLSGREPHFPPYGFAKQPAGSPPFLLSHRGSIPPTHARFSHQAGPQPSPDFSAYHAERFALVRWLLDRHARLANQRGLAALLLCLVNLLAAASTIWVFIQSTQLIDPALRPLRLAVLLLAMLALVFQFAALFLALATVVWLRLSAGPGAASDLSQFFHSGDGSPPGLAVLNNENDFHRLLQQANRENMFAAAQRDLFRQARLRQRQERFLLPALVCTAAGLLALFFTALVAFVAVI